MPIPGVFPGAVAAAAGVAGGGPAEYDPWCGLQDIGPFSNGNQHDYTVTLNAPPGPDRFILAIAHWRLSNTHNNTTTYVNGAQADSILRYSDVQAVSNMFTHTVPAGATCTVRLECLPTELNASTLAVWCFANAVGDANPISAHINHGTSHINGNFRQANLTVAVGDYACVGTGIVQGTNATGVTLGSGAGETIDTLAELINYRTSFNGFKFGRNYPNVNGGNMQPNREHTPSENKYVSLYAAAVKASVI